jgi:hypothetical protein
MTPKGRIVFFGALVGAPIGPGENLGRLTGIEVRVRDPRLLPWPSAVKGSQEKNGNGNRHR